MSAWAFKMTCHECEWLVIAESQNECLREARHHPHATYTRAIATDELIDMDLGSGAPLTAEPVAEPAAPWRNRATAVKFWDDAFYIETPDVSGNWYSPAGALSLAFVWMAIEAYWDYQPAVDAGVRVEVA